MDDARAGMMLFVPISKADAQAYLDRWSMVRDAERVQLQTTPLEIKVKQLAALMESRELFGSDPKREQEIEEVRTRWALLRKVLSG
jgi:hypothetical protein